MFLSSSDSELERKKRKAKKALEDLAAAAGLLQREKGAASAVKPEPVPPPSTAYNVLHGAGTSSADLGEEDFAGKWRPMALKVKLGRSSDEPEVEESRMVYMKEERKAPAVSQFAPVEQDEDLPPGEDKVSFQIKSFGLFGPGNRQAQKVPSPTKAIAEEAKQEVHKKKR